MSLVSGCLVGMGSPDLGGGVKGDDDLESQMQISVMEVTNLICFQPISNKGRVGALRKSFGSFQEGILHILSEFYL